MPESFEAVLAGATQSALERTAFLFAEPWTPDNDAADALGPEPFVATVGFDGTHRGAVSITFPASLLPTLAANILGEDESPSDSMQRDALGELANIICGNVLPGLDPAGTYSLGPPQVSAGERSCAASEAVLVASSDLQVDGERVGTTLWLRSPARPA
jgi:CheY-specific phosphatase CheX